MADDASPESGADGLSDREQRRAVRERYAAIARGESADGSDAGSPSCSDDADGSSCCGGSGDEDAPPADRSRLLGYSADDLDAVAPGANLGLGCGNPTGLARLEEGDTVLDLGSGAGFDCFLAAREVGDSGRVVGVDMTPAVVEKARENAAENDATNVEFRLGEIEHLPVADGTVDVVVSNCVVNLSPDKRQVFEEAYRVLAPGGRLAISDVVLTAEPPAGVETDPASVAACVGGAAPIPELEDALAAAGFEDLAVEPKAEGDAIVREWDDERDLSDFVTSATIEGRKPAE